jgi:lipopolysaccharide/colanic/teichoic acid biosynthesis glycosyltransferase
VSARSDGDLEVQQALDTYYIRNWSIWIDLYILWRTVGAVLAGRGAR